MSTTVAELNPFDSEVIESPWEFFKQLREQASIYLLPNGAYYLVSRYKDVIQAVMDTDTFSSNLVAVMLSGAKASDQPQMMTLSGGRGDARKAQATDVLAIADPPNHTRQRRVANRALTMRRIASMEASIQTLCDKLVDDLQQQCNTGDTPVNWVEHFAAPLPLIIIVELLGLPSADIPKLKRWSDASVALLSGINTSEQLIEHGEQINKMIGYLAESYDQAYDNPGNNLLGDLIRESKIDAEQFGRDEVVSMLVQLLSAGNETTASLLGSAMMLLLQDPDLQASLRASPDKIANFIEEVLRVEAPFHGHFRVVKQDTQLAGVDLKAGDRLMLLWSSAGRDEQQFDSAEKIDLYREKPKSHLSFGYGIHHCIGAALSRAEARIAIETILQRSKNLRMAENNTLQHVPSLFIRSLRRLDIHLMQ